MVPSRFSRIQLTLLASFSLVLLVALACGTSAEPTATSAPQATATEAPMAQPTTSSGNMEPTAMPMATTEPAMTEPSGGTINVGQSELGPFIFHPTTVGNPQIFLVSTAIGEGLLHFDKNNEVQPMLAESWDISDDFLTWTFHIRHGVQFHKGYGELTADDIIYTYRDGWANSTIHARASFIKDFWQHPDGSVEAPDDYTVVVNTGVPWIDVRAFEFFRDIGGTSANVVSKKQSDELGVEAASRDIAMTGPWQIEEAKTGEYWKMSAVQNHWRKTPNFGELVFWEIPEESARVAGFQTGNLDTFAMNFDDISAVEDVPGAKVMKAGLIGQAGLNLYDQQYVGVGTPDQDPSFDGTKAWVSANPDINSPEWENARKVRKALSLAIDRQSIVDTLLHGYGGVLPVRDWAGFDSRMPDTWHWDYDPDKAQQLLDEAGYPDGFTIELATAIRGVPAEVEACEAIATMWGDIGVDVKFQNIPYTTLRPQLVARTWGGATCHSVSIRLEPVLGLSNYLNETVFNYGTFHPWLEDHIPTAFGELDSTKRFQEVTDIYDWMVMQQALGFGLYYVEGAVPVGPNINEWNYTSYSDTRIPNGYENITPRQ